MALVFHSGVSKLAALYHALGCTLGLHIQLEMPNANIMFPSLFSVAAHRARGAFAETVLTPLYKDAFVYLRREPKYADAQKPPQGTNHYITSHVYG